MRRNGRNDTSVNPIIAAMRSHPAIRRFNQPPPLQPEAMLLDETPIRTRKVQELYHAGH
jgi:hypothetical protein